jgi:glycosyltransferase involved in cell wall biosynthesis
MSDPPSNSRAIVFTEIEQFGGAERAALALARWLTERELPVHIVCYSDRSDLASYADFPLEVVQLLPRPAAIAKIGALRKYFACSAASLLKPLLSGYQPAMHGTLAGLRGFHDLMHDTPSLFDPDAAGLKHRLRRLVSDEIVGNGLRSGGKTIVTSEFLREECRRDFRVDAEIARMGGLSGEMHGGVKLRPFAATRELRMLSVCRLEANKRLDWLLRALAGLENTATAALGAPLSQLADWRFDIAGKGPQLELLRTLAQELGITHRVRFHGFVPDAELEAMYAEAHLFLMPAVQGYGIPAIEALGRGIPVLLHRESGVSDILLDTPWATVFAGDEPNTQPALAKAIEGVGRGRHLDVALPELPTEDAWAERVAMLCGWS